MKFVEDYFSSMFILLKYGHKQLSLGMIAIIDLLRYFERLIMKTVIRNSTDMLESTDFPQHDDFFLRCCPKEDTAEEVNPVLYNSPGYLQDEDHFYCQRHQ